MNSKLGCPGETNGVLGMSIYLQDIPLSEAQSIFHNALEKAGLWRILETEEINLDEFSQGRVLAEPVWAKISSPHYHASAMDGFALQAEATIGASPTSPLVLMIGPLTTYVDTGDPLPEWADAVVPVELVEPLDEKGRGIPEMRRSSAIRVRAALTPWTNIRPMGEDIVATQLVLPAGQVLRPVDLGAIVASGHATVRVSRKPKVAIIPTGTELIQPGQIARPGDIIEYNSIVLAAQVNAWGGLAKRYPIIPDDYEKIIESVMQAAGENDLVLLNAGSSAGSEDFSTRVISECGDLLVHGVAVRPGHPVILGMIHYSEERIVPIIGVPGYPVSAALTGEIFVEPLIDYWSGRQPFEPLEVTASLTRKITSPPGDEDFMRVVVGRVDDQLLAAPLPRGAGIITSLARADGIIVVPAGTQGLESGTKVKVRLYRSVHELEHTIFCIGSHDITLDLLAQSLTGFSRRLVSANVGSLGGLLALRRGEAHLAGSHLLDPQTGDYNLSYIKQYLPETPVRLVTWVFRQQGLLVNQNNPKDIRSLVDLARPEVRFINRQRGAGTRVLLDFELSKLGIKTRNINGYTQEVYTHLAVAAAIASHRADCGLGIAAAAQALELDFIPLFQERYDMVIPLRFFTTDLLSPIFELMQSPSFRKTIAALPGYDVSKMGDFLI
jgi:putative molybdopterin biosynthesis protein